LYVSVWSRGPATYRLTRNISPLKPDLKMTQTISLQDRFYPIRISLPSCIQLPEVEGDKFKLNPQFINTLMKYYGLESKDAYFFIREFEEVCVMMKILQLGDRTVKLHFVFFSFKCLAKKWLYSLAENSITTWDDFVKVFLEKLYPIHKTALIRKNIMQCKKEPNEPF